MKTLAIPLKEYPVSLVFRHSDPPIYVQAILPGYSQLPANVVAHDVLLIPEKLSPVPTRRLIVIVPADEIDEHLLAHRVWELASGLDLQILYLGLSPQEEFVASQRRRLAYLAACTTNQEIHAQFKLSTERGWIRALEKILKPGDLPVCLAGHQISVQIIRQKTLSKHLVEKADVPVYVLGEVNIDAVPYWQPFIKEAFVWITSLMILAAFFYLQVAIDRSMVKPVSTILFILTVLVEIYSLFKIHEWMG